MPLDPSTGLGEEPGATLRDRAIQTSQILEAIQEQLELDADQRDAMIVPFVRRFGPFVHDLPASESNHHALPFGLFDHSLSTAFWAVRLPLKGILRQFPRRSVRLLLFFAAALHDIGKVRQVRVEDDATGGAWDPDEEDLAKFAERSAQRSILWMPDRTLFRPDTPASAEFADAFVPIDAIGVFRVDLPLAALAPIFSPKEYALEDDRPFISAIRSCVTSADRSSAWDDHLGIDPLAAFAFGDHLRRAARRPSAFVLAPPRPPLLSPSARELVSALLLLARLRAACNSFLEHLVVDFRETLGHPPYRLFVHDRTPNRGTRLCWGRFTNKKSPDGSARPYSFDRFEPSKVYSLAELMRYLPVFYEAECASNAFYRLGVRAGRRLRTANDRLRPFKPIDDFLPQDLEVYLHNPEVAASAGVAYLTDLLRRALAFDAEYLALHEEAWKLSRNIRGLLTGHQTDVSPALSAGARQLMASGIVSFQSLPAKLPAPGYLKSSFLFVVNGIRRTDRLTKNALRSLGLSHSQASAFSRVDAELYRFRRELGRLDAIRTFVLEAASEAAPEAYRNATPSIAG